MYQRDDVDLIRDYNPSYDDGYDIVTFAETGDDTKVSWCASKGMFPISPREFITRVRYLRTEDGAVAVLSEGLKSHERAPQLRPGSVRACIKTAVQLVAPRGDGKCYFTSIAQVDPGGTLPAWFTNTFARRDAPRALLRLEAAAQRTMTRKPSRGTERSWAGVGEGGGGVDRKGEGVREVTAAMPSAAELERSLNEAIGEALGKKR